MGVTNNLERRVYEHKNNIVKGFTSKYSVHQLVYYEETNDIEGISYLLPLLIERGAGCVLRQTYTPLCPLFLEGNHKRLNI